MARPQIIANGGSPGVKASVAADSLVTLTLDSLVGVRSIQWQVLSTDDTGTPSSYPLTITGSIGQQATFTAGALATAVIVQVMVNNGLVRGVFTPSLTMNTIKVYVETADGLEVGATGEQYESDSEHGTTAILNGPIRRLNSMSLQIDGAPAKFASVVATSNISLSGSQIVDGVSLVTGDVVLAAGQTTASQNGLYDVDTTGAWTRSESYDSQNEILAAIITIAAGTVGALKLYQCTNTGTIVVGTTGLSFAQLPNRADKSKLDAATSTPTLDTLVMWDGGARLHANAFVGPGLVSSLGLLRAAYNGTIVSALDSTGLIDLGLLGTTTVDRAFLGSSNVSGANVIVGTGGNIQAIHGSTTFATVSSSGGYVFGPSALFKILQTAPAGSAAGQDAEIAAQDATTSGDGGDLNLRSGIPAGASSPGDVRIDLRDDGTLSGRFILRAGSFGDQLEAYYNSSEPFWSVSIPDGIDATAGAIGITATSFAFVAPSNGALYVQAAGVGIGSAGSFGSGERVVFVKNAATVPTTNPTDGFVLYGEAGAAKVRGSGGTVTTIGPAEPHCPACSRDFALEWRNDANNEHLAVCVPCMIEAIERAGVSPSEFAFVRSLQARHA